MTAFNLFPDNCSDEPFFTENCGYIPLIQCCQTEDLTRSGVFVLEDEISHSTPDRVIDASYALVQQMDACAGLARTTKESTAMIVAGARSRVSYIKKTGYRIALNEAPYHYRRIGEPLEYHVTLPSARKALS